MKLALFTIIFPKDSNLNDLIESPEDRALVEKTQMAIVYFSLQKATEFLALPSSRLLFKNYFISEGSTRIIDHKVLKRNSVGYFEATFYILNNLFQISEQQSDIQKSSVRNELEAIMGT
jgi:hypothetical protein